MMISTFELLSNYALPSDHSLQFLKNERSPSPYDPQFFEFDMQRVIKEEPTESDCGDSVSPYPTANDEPVDSRFITMYPSNSNLTALEPYKPDSDSGSPLLFARMLPLTYNNGHLSSGNEYHVPNPIQMALDSHQRSSPCEQPRNYPGVSVFDSRTPEHERFGSNGTDGSSSSSSPASTPWAANNELHAENSSVSNIPDLAPNGHQPAFDMVTRECVNCGTMLSGIWWPDETGHFLCANCTRYRHVDALHRNEVALPKSKSQKRTVIKKTNQVCTNCKTTHTSLWRRNPSGETVCNACGLYFKLHKTSRPLTMRKDSIQKRKRKPKVKGEKNIPTPPMTPKIMENNVHNMMEQSHQATPSPPSYNAPHILTSRNGALEQTHSSRYSVGPTLPHVHSPEGFRSTLIRYDSPCPLSPSISVALLSSDKAPSPLISNGSISYSTSSPSASPPCSSATFSSYISPNVVMIPSPSPSPSPTVATLLSSGSIFQHTNDSVHHSFLHSPAAEQCPVQQPSYNSD